MRENIVDEQTFELEVNFNTLIDTYSNFANMVYDLYIDQPEVLDLFAKGLQAKDVAQQDYYREELYKLLLPIYEMLQTNNFRQLHFHDVESNSYLRFHRPDKFGDSLVGVRDTVTYVNETHTPVIAFEEGRIFNGYRFVYPLRMDGIYLGSVEISIAIHSILDLMSSDSVITHQFIIDREVVESKVFNEELDNYIPWPLSDKYYIEVEAIKNTNNQPFLSEQDSARLIQFLETNKEKDIPETNFAIPFKNGTIVSGYAVQNFQGNLVGYLLNLSKQPSLLDIQKSRIFYIVSVLISFILLILIFIATEKWAQRLKKEKDTLDLVQAIGKMGSWRYEVKQDRLIWSDEIYRIFGIDPKSFKATYESFFSFVHPEDREMLDEVYQSSLKNKTGYNVRHRVLREDGTILYVDEIANHEYDKEGNPIRSVGTVQDVTRLVEYEQNILNKNDILIQAQNVARLGYWSHNFISNETEWSDELFKIFGLDPKQAVPSIETFLKQVHPNDREKVIKIINSKSADPLIKYRHRILRKDGSISHIQAIERVFYKDGKPIKSLGTFLDITDLVEKENQLQQMKNKLESVVNKVPDIIFTCIKDKEYTVSYINDAVQQITGYRAKAFLHGDKSLRSIIHPDDKIRIDEEIKKAIEQNQVYKLDYRILTADGETIFVQEIGQQTIDEEGKEILEGSIADMSLHKDPLGRMRKFLDYQDNIVVLSDGTHLYFANKKFFDFTGFENQKAFLSQHRCICDLFLENDHVFHLSKIKENEENWVESLMNIGESDRIVSMNDKSQTPRTFAVNINRYEQDMYLITFTNISENFSDKIRFKEKSLIDSLTGTNNREFFQNNISQILNQNEERGHKTGLVMIDIDFFKKINDTYGHDVGDLVLRQVVKVFMESTRKDDKIIRWGGDEFIIVAEVENDEGIKSLAEKIRNEIKTFKFQSIDTLSCSFGVAVHKKGKAIEQTIKEADIALYKAKENGRDCVEGLVNSSQ